MFDINQAQAKKIIWKCKRQTLKIMCKWIKTYLCHLWINLPWSEKELSGNRSNSAAKDPFNAQKNVSFPLLERLAVVQKCRMLLWDVSRCTAISFVSVTMELFERGWSNADTIRNGIADAACVTLGLYEIISLGIVQSRRTCHCIYSLSLMTFNNSNLWVFSSNYH